MAPTPRCRLASGWRRRHQDGPAERLPRMREAALCNSRIGTFAMARLLGQPGARAFNTVLKELLGTFNLRPSGAMSHGLAVKLLAL